MSARIEKVLELDSVLNLDVPLDMEKVQAFGINLDLDKAVDTETGSVISPPLSIKEVEKVIKAIHTSPKNKGHFHFLKQKNDKRSINPLKHR